MGFTKLPARRNKAARHLHLPKRIPSELEAPNPLQAPELLQFKVWLLGISPMIWRRVQVPASMTLREPHGVFQVAMGWEGIHPFQFTLRARRFGSRELAARAPDIPLSELRLRLGTRVRYGYDLNRPWEHEVRLESRQEADPGRRYPICLDGDGSCPPEDCGRCPAFWPNVRSGSLQRPVMTSRSSPISLISSF